MPVPDFRKAQNLPQYLILAQFKSCFKVELFIPTYCLTGVIFGKISGIIF